MDVSAIAVGTDFVDQVERAISTSDVSLVVMGPNWLGATDPEGRRRLDDPEDHVRSEVRSALASPNPVVPVQVGDASLPTEDQLPDDLKALARRQAVELRDETWSEDVEMLVRRLEGKETVGKSRRWIPVAIGLVVLGVAGVLIWQAQTDGDGDLPPCPARDGTWIPVEMAEDATEVEPLPDGRALLYRVGRTDYKYESGQWPIVLDVRLENVSEDVEGIDDHIGYGDTAFHALRVDRVSAGPPTCFEARGDRDLAPEEAEIARVGFISLVDPTEASLMLETDGPLMIQITPGA